MKLYSLFRTVFFLLGTLLALGACTALGGTTWNIQVGGGSGTVIAYGFFPSTVHIHVGETVAWKVDGPGKHTVTFLNGEPAPALYLPLVERPDSLIENPQVKFPTNSNTFDGSQFANSGTLEALGANSWALSFQRAGTYTFTDLFGGKNITGTIVVENAQVTVPTQATLDAQGRQELQSVLSQEAATRQAAQANFSKASNNDGTTTYHVQVGATSASGQLQIMEFFPSDLTIAQHDTVAWTVPPNQTLPHTVTFLADDPSIPFLLFTQQPNGRMLGMVNPTAVAPAPGPAIPYAGGRLFNSGLLGNGLKAGLTYSLNFTLPGRFQYTDLAQTAIGMSGSISTFSHVATGEVAPADQTASTANYKIHFLIGPNETVLTPDQAKTAKSGQVLVSGQSAQPEGKNLLNYYIQVTATDLKSGQKITNQPVTVQIQNEVTDKIQTLEIAQMYDAALGQSSLHYGNNITLDAGNYTITVQIGNESAKFRISVLPPRPLPGGPGGAS